MLIAYCLHTWGSCHDVSAVFTFSRHRYLIFQLFFIGALNHLFLSWFLISFKKVETKSVNESFCVIKIVVVVKYYFLSILFSFGRKCKHCKRKLDIVHVLGGNYWDQTGQCLLCRVPSPSKPMTKCCVICSVIALYAGQSQIYDQKFTPLGVFGFPSKIPKCRNYA